MMLDFTLFMILLLIVYWIMEDVIGQFLYCCLLVGLFFYRTTFITYPVGLENLVQVILSILIFCSLAKFYWMVKKRKERQDKGELASIFEGQ